MGTCSDDLSGKYRIPLFDGVGFSNWKFRIEIFLEEEDLISCIQKEIGDYEELIISATDSEAVKKRKETERNNILKSQKKCKS